MASTVSDAVLTVTISESIFLNGSNHGSTKKIALTGINEISKRIMSVPATPGTQIYAGAATAANGTFVTDQVKYIRITNLDSANSIILHLSDGSSTYSMHEIAAGHVFFLTDLDSSFETQTSVNLWGTSTVDISEIYAMSTHASDDVDIEIFVASS